MKPNRTSKKPILILSLVLLALLTLTFGAFALEAYAKGDVSGDAQITAEDARLALRGAVGLEHYEPGSKEYNAADVDGEEGLSAGDARLILRAAVGLEDLNPDVPENPSQPEEPSKPEEPSQPAVPDTQVYVIENWEDFPKVLGELFDKEKERFEEIGFDGYIDEFFTCRIIVKATSAPDYSGYHPTIVIDGPDDYYLYQFQTQEEAKAFQAEMEKQDNVVFAEPDKIIGIVPNPDDDGAAMTAAASHNSWGVTYIQADKYASYLKNNKYTSQIVVAVVDSGVDNTHSYLKNKLVAGYDFVNGDSTPYEGTNGTGHGTHVSGTIIDCMPGLNVKIMPVRVLGLSGSGSTTSVAAGVSYAASHGAKVINLSLGGGHSSMLDDAINTAVKKGVTVCVAAGNESRNTSSSCPAHITTAGCICVSAIDSSGKPAYFTNYGSHVDVAGPGVGILSCVPGGWYESWNGTSMATPHISAVAAMYKLRYSSATPAQVEQYVRKYVKDIYTSGRDNYTGYGVPQMSKAIPTTTYTLTLKKGTGIASVSGGGKFASGDKVTVTATVSSGYVFSKWTSSNTSLLKNSTSQTYTFTMPKGNVTLTASAVKAPKYTLTVKKGTGIATISYGTTTTSGSTITQSIAAGTKVTVKATVSSNYKWSKWTSSNTSLLASSTSQTYTFTMPKGNITLTAGAVSAVPSTKAEIINYYVAAYNKIGSQAKTIKRTKSSVSNYKNIVEIGNNSLINNVVKSLIENLMVEDNSEFTGSVKDLPPKGISSLSISSSQVSSATIKDNGTTYTIVLKSTGSDSSYEYNAKPGSGSAGMIGPLVDNNDIKDAVPNFTFNGLNTKYARATVTATISKSTGRITQLVFDTPGIVYCSSVKYSFVTVNNPQVGVELKQTWKISY